jgi:hypothetical protein
MVVSQQLLKYNKLLLLIVDNPIMKQVLSAQNLLHLQEILLDKVQVLMKVFSVLMVLNIEVIKIRLNQERPARIGDLILLINI